MITKFSGKYRFLSNFWPCQIEWDGHWTSVENAYQGAKVQSSKQPLLKEAIRESSAGEAKKLGHTALLPKWWEENKEGIMKRLLIEKFAIPELQEKAACNWNRSTC